MKVPLVGVITGSVEISDEGRNLLVANRHTYHSTTGGRKLPHQIDYVDLLMTLRARGAQRIVAFHTVGGISFGLEPGAIVLPDDVLDQTWDRKVIQQGPLNPHMAVNNLFDREMRESIFAGLQTRGFRVVCGGVMAVTQGPRLETPAEIRALRSLGASIVGMTAMPEAFVALQLGIPYVSVALVVNSAAGLGSEEELDPEYMHRIGSRFQPGLVDLVLKIVGRVHPW